MQAAAQAWLAAPMEELFAFVVLGKSLAVFGQFLMSAVAALQKRLSVFGQFLLSAVAVSKLLAWLALDLTPAAEMAKQVGHAAFDGKAPCRQIWLTVTVQRSFPLTLLGE